MSLQKAVEKFFRVMNSDGPMMDWDKYFEAVDEMEQALDQYRDTLCLGHCSCLTERDQE